jgi:hypothetical protein
MRDQSSNIYDSGKKGTDTSSGDSFGGTPDSHSPAVEVPPIRLSASCELGLLNLGNVVGRRTRQRNRTGRGVLSVVLVLDRLVGNAHALRGLAR